MDAYAGCKHFAQDKFGRRYTLWRRLRHKNLEKENIFIFYCKFCQTIKRKKIEITAEDGVIDLAVKTKIIKNQREEDNEPTVSRDSGLHPEFLEKTLEEEHAEAAENCNRAYFTTGTGEQDQP